MNSNATASCVRDVPTQQDNMQNRRPKAANDSILDTLATEALTLRDRAVISLLIDTGLRGGEIARLNRSMIIFDTDENGGGGEFSENKSPTNRTFRFGPRTARALQAYLRSERVEDHSEALFLGYEGNRLSRPRLSKMIHRLCARLGIDRISIHQYRVNLAHRFVNGGGSPVVLAKLLGHDSYTTTVRLFGAPSDSIALRATKAASTDSAVR